MPSPGSSGQPRSSGRGPTPTVNNHYVPEWHQKRFLVPGNSQFRYLDLRPEPIPGAPRGTRRKSILNWGPARCFAQDHLYTIKLGPWMSDMIEQGFFKRIDDDGRAGCEFFSDFDIKKGFGEAWHGVMAFMDAQRFRTPRGLAYFSTLTNVNDRNALLLTLQRVFQRNATMWTEGIWEVVKATASPTKFLLTDNPVTFYNARAFPGAPMMAFPRDAELAWVGTRTIFPLDLETCLIITHREFTRNPWKPAMRDRINARNYADTIFNGTQVQTGRMLDEGEVRRINFILKKRADRYIAACNEDWLYPERHISVSWSKLDDDWFLLPNLFEIHLGGMVAVGYKNGRSEAWDDNGRRPDHPDYDKHERNESYWHRHGQREWGVRRLFKAVGTSHQFHHRGKDRPFWDNYVLEEIEKHLIAQPRPGGKNTLAEVRQRLADLGPWLTRAKRPKDAAESEAEPVQALPPNPPF